MQLSHRRFFDAVIKPQLCKMSLDGTLPYYHMDKLSYTDFEDAANKFYANLDVNRERDIITLSRFTTDGERAFDAIIKANRNTTLANVLDDFNHIDNDFRDMTVQEFIDGFLDSRI